MKRFMLPTMTCLLIFCASSLGQEVKDSPLYPLKKGTQWTYTASGSTVVVRVAGFEKLGDTMCAKLETLDGNKAAASEHIAVGIDGIYRHAINNQKPEKPIQILKLPPKDGDSWEIDTKITNNTLKGKFVVRKDKLKVEGIPGEVEAWVVDGKNFSVAGRSAAVKYWFVEKYGIAKMVFELDGNEATLELKAFEAGK